LEKAQSMAVPFIDIHTHQSALPEDTISVGSFFLQDIDPQQKLSVPFTAGLHPWHSADFNKEEILKMLENLQGQSRMIAIGEVGLDKKCKVDFTKQFQVFQIQFDFAVQNKFPLIIHNVGAWNEMLLYSKGSTIPFIFHGYNGNMEITRQLITRGCYFSIGKGVLKENNRFSEVLKIIPWDHLFCETDDAEIDIREVYGAVANLLNCEVGELKRQILINYNKIFSQRTA